MQKGLVSKDTSPSAFVARSFVRNPCQNFPGTSNSAGGGSLTPDPLITNQMLYQLSYASTGKPSKIITQAIKLQATFCPPQNHCQIATSPPTSSTSSALLYSESHFLSYLVCLFRLFLRRRCGCLRGRFRRRLRKLAVGQLQIMMHFREPDDEGRAGSGLSHGKRQFHAVQFGVIVHVRRKFRDPVRRVALVHASHHQPGLRVEIYSVR